MLEVFKNYWNSSKNSYTEASEISGKPIDATKLALQPLDPRHLLDGAKGIAGDILYRSNRTALEASVMVPYRGLVDGLNVSKEAVKDITQIELIKNISKGITEVGTAGGKIIKSGWNLLWNPLTPGAWGGLIQNAFGFVPYTVKAVASTAGHTIGDLAALPFQLLGGFTRFAGGLTRAFGQAGERFGEQGLVYSDLIERGITRTFVPKAWQEEGEREYQYLNQWGADYTKLSGPSAATAPATQ